LDRWRVLGALLLCASLPLSGAQNAQEIYKRSVKVFAVDKIRLHVRSVMKRQAYEQEQHFTLTRYAKGNTSDTLVCFSYPQNIKGTAILLKNSGKTASTLVYFPALGRSRLIPKEDENNEAFGLGLSFAELQNKAENIQELEEVTKEGRTYYKLAKINAKQKTLYFIDKKSMLIKEMDIYENAKLIKKVFIDKAALFHGKKIITQWHIQDFEKEKTTTYSVDTKSITTSFSKRIFKRSALSHCKP
jgi:ribosomal protein S8